MAKKNLSNRVAAIERQVAEIKVRAVEAGEFRLVDKAGQVRATLELTKSGPRLAMMHEDGRIAIEATVTRFGPGVRLTDEDGQTRVFIGATRDEARIGLADSQEKPRMFLGVSRSGKPKITIYDAKQKKLWEAPR